MQKIKKQPDKWSVDAFITAPMHNQAPIPATEILKMIPYSFLKNKITIFLLLFLAYGSTSYAIDITKEISGSWFNPEQDGHGFLLEVIPGDILVAYWFSYDTDGNQAWMVGAGDINGNTATVPVIITQGGIFGDGFDPNAVIRNDWGTLIFTFDSCNTGNVVYNVGFGSGSLPIQRLTSITGLECHVQGIGGDSGRIINGVVFESETLFVGGTANSCSLRVRLHNTTSQFKVATLFYEAFDAAGADIALTLTQELLPANSTIISDTYWITAEGNALPNCTSIASFELNPESVVLP